MENRQDRSLNSNEGDRSLDLGAQHLSGFLTCKVLRLSGNFMLKKVEFTGVLPLFYLYFS